MKFIKKINKFMYGRYGIDELYIFSFKLYFILFILNLFLKNIIISNVQLLVFIVMFYRVFSKKVHKRKEENQIYLKIRSKLLKPFKNIKRNIKDQEHIYKRCPKCKTTMKLPLPYERGFKIAKCPECGNRTKVFVLRKAKVEIIKSK